MADRFSLIIVIRHPSGNDMDEPADAAGEDLLQKCGPALIAHGAGRRLLRDCDISNCLEAKESVNLADFFLAVLLVSM